MSFGIAGKVGFVQLASIDKHAAVVYADGVMRDGDDAFHRQIVVTRKAYSNDFSVPRVSETVNPAMHDASISVVERRVHAWADNRGCMEDEMADKEVRYDGPEQHTCEDKRARTPRDSSVVKESSCCHDIIYDSQKREGKHGGFYFEIPT